MNHVPFGAVIAFVTGLVVAFVLIFAIIRAESPVNRSLEERRKTKGIQSLLPVSRHSGGRPKSAKLPFG